MADEDSVAPPEGVGSSTLWLMALEHAESFPSLHLLSINFENSLFPSPFSMGSLRLDFTQTIFLLSTSTGRRPKGPTSKRVECKQWNYQEILTDRLSLAKAAERQGKEREKVSQEARWQLLSQAPHTSHV